MRLEPDDIAAALFRCRRRTSVSLAARLDVTRQQVSEVVRGRRRTVWLRREIAMELGMTYDDLWGESDPGTQREANEPALPQHDTSSKPDGQMGRPAQIPTELEFAHPRRSPVEDPS